MEDKNIAREILLKIANMTPEEMHEKVTQIIFANNVVREN